MTAAWAAALDAFEARLDDQLAALGGADAASVPAFVAPADLGPLPPVLRPRAEALLRHSADLERLLEARMAVAAGGGRAGDRPQPGARFVDQLA